MYKNYSWPKGKRHLHSQQKPADSWKLSRGERDRKVWKSFHPHWSLNSHCRYFYVIDWAIPIRHTQVIVVDKCASNLLPQNCNFILYAALLSFQGFLWDTFDCKHFSSCSVFGQNYFRKCTAVKEKKKGKKRKDAFRWQHLGSCYLAVKTGSMYYLQHYTSSLVFCARITINGRGQVQGLLNLEEDMSCTNAAICTNSALVQFLPLLNGQQGSF